MKRNNATSGDPTPRGETHSCEQTRETPEANCTNSPECKTARSTPEKTVLKESNSMPSTLLELDQVDGEDPSSLVVDLEETKLRIVTLKDHISRMREKDTSLRDEVEKLEDWFLEQMSKGGVHATNFQNDDNDTSSKNSVAIRNHYNKQLKDLHKQLKQNERNIERLEFIVCQLHAHGIPQGTDYKDYMRHLKCNRPRGAPINAILPHDVLAMHSSKSVVHPGHHGGSLSPEGSHRKERPNGPSKANTLETSSPSTRHRTVPKQQTSAKSEETYSVTLNRAAKEDLSICRSDPDDCSAALLDSSTDSTDKEASSISKKFNAPPSIVYQHAPHLADSLRIKQVSSSESLIQLEQQVNDCIAAISNQAGFGNSLAAPDSHPPLLGGHSSVYGSQPNLVSNGSCTSGSATTQNDSSATPQSSSKSKLKRMRTGLESWGKQLRRKTDKSLRPRTELNGGSRTISENNLAPLVKLSENSEASSASTLPKQENTGTILTQMSQPAKRPLSPDKDRHSSPSRSLFGGAGSSNSDSLSLPQSKSRTRELPTCTNLDNTQIRSHSKTDTGLLSTRLATQQSNGPSTKSSSKKASSISGPLLSNGLEPKTSNYLPGLPAEHDQILSRIIGLISSDAMSSGILSTCHATLLDQQGKSSATRTGGSSASSVSTPPNVVTAPNSHGSGSFPLQSKPSGLGHDQINLCRALAMMYCHNQNSLNSSMQTITQQNADLQEELSRMNKLNLQQQELISSMNVELISLRRDLGTLDRLHNEQSEAVGKRMEKLDMKVEESRQTVQEQSNDHKRMIDSLQYNLTTKTRDLSDNINTVNNRFSILENSFEQYTTSKVHNSPNGAMAKVVHKFADLLVSMLVAATSLFQVLIQSLNAVASIAENKTFALLFYASFVLAVVIFLYPKFFKFFSEFS